MLIMLLYYSTGYNVGVMIELGICTEFLYLNCDKEVCLGLLSMYGLVGCFTLFSTHLYPCVRVAYVASR